MPPLQGGASSYYYAHPTGHSSLGSSSPEPPAAGGHATRSPRSRALRSIRGRRPSHGPSRWASLSGVHLGEWGIISTSPRLKPGGSKGNRRGLSQGGATPGLGVGSPLWGERPARTPAGPRPPKGGRHRPSPRRLHYLAPRRSRGRSARASRRVPGCRSPGRQRSQPCDAGSGQTCPAHARSPIGPTCVGEIHGRLLEVDRAAHPEDLGGELAVQSLAGRPFAAEESGEAVADGPCPPRGVPSRSPARPAAVRKVVIRIGGPPLTVEAALHDPDLPEGAERRGHRTGAAPTPSAGRRYRSCARRRDGQ